jgi:kinesin family protein 3/17
MSEDSPRTENVKVVVRVRPISDSEKNSGYKGVVKVDSVRNGIGVCNQISSSTSSTSFNEMERTFHFDSVFGPESSQVSLNLYLNHLN